MADLIDRQALIKDMCNNKTVAKCPCYPNCYPCDFSEARRIIDIQPTIDPEKSGEYLVEFRVQLKKAMEKRNITQSQLCERTGIPKSAMSQYLSGAFRPKQERIRILAKALRTTPEYLMGFTDGIEIPQSPAVNRWIPVEDALPEIGYSVLVTRQTESNTRYIRIASRQDDCWMDNTDKYGKPNPHPVIAWMPMPDPYEPPESEVQDDD